METEISKTDQRHQNKKRKIEAYLRLAEDNERERSAKRRITSKNEDSSSQDSSDAKTKCKSSKKKAKIKRGNTDRPDKLGNADRPSNTDTPSKADKPGKAGKADSPSDGEKTCLTSNPIKLELKELRARKIARKKQLMEWPKVFLNAEFSSQNLVPASCGVLHAKKDVKPLISLDEVPPLFIIDMQHVLLFGIEGNITSYKPRFCSLLRCSRVSQVMVIVVDGLTADSYRENKDSFPFLSEHFAIKVPLVSPSQYGSSVVDELFNVPLSETQIRAMRKKSEGANTKVLKNLHRKLLAENQAVVPVTVTSSSSQLAANEATAQPVPVLKAEMDPHFITRADLLLSPQQMLHERYPMPAHTGQFQDYVTTKAVYKSVNRNSPMFAIDCEMCQTDKFSHELTWIAMVDEDLQVVYESLVKPTNRITDYLTRFSGITAERMKNVTTRLADVQNALRELLPANAILCGQSFNSDLKALRMFHPYVIDTSVIYNLSGARHYKPGLRLLAAEFLSETIQDGGAKGHSPVEDAVTTMKLIKHKLETTNVCYGDIILHNSAIASRSLVRVDGVTPKEKCDSDMTVRRIFFKRPGTTLTRSFFDLTKNCEKSVLFVDREVDAAPYRDEVDACFATGSDDETLDVVMEHMASHVVAWVQLHECAAFAEAGEEDRQKMFKKTDKHIRQLVSTVADKSMVVVIFPGSTEKASLQDGLGCIHIAGTMR